LCVKEQVVTDRLAAPAGCVAVRGLWLDNRHGGPQPTALRRPSPRLQARRPARCFRGPARQDFPVRARPLAQPATPRWWALPAGGNRCRGGAAGEGHPLLVRPGPPAAAAGAPILPAEPGPAGATAHPGARLNADPLGRGLLAASQGACLMSPWPGGSRPMVATRSANSCRLTAAPEPPARRRPCRLAAELASLRSHRPW